MKKITICIIINLFSLLLYAIDISFVLNKDIEISDTNMQNSYIFSKGEIFKKHQENYGIGITNDNPLLIQIFVYNENKRNSFEIPVEVLDLQDNNNVMSESIKNYYWIADYYYEQLNEKNRKSVVLRNEPFWKTFTNSTEDQTSTWIDFFKIEKFYFGDYFFLSFGTTSFDETGFIGFLDKIESDLFSYKILDMYSNFGNYMDKYSHPRPTYIQLFEKQSPYNIIFLLDGDYMKMYIDEVSEKNLFQTLIRTSPEACNQIENWIKGKSNDLSKVVMPKHGNPSVQTEVTKTNATNVVQNKTMIVSENLKLRSGEATTSEVITVMQAGTKVKILELGKAENIDGINSNWVKVEVQSGAKDRDGNTISKDTVGWCYGGYLAETTEANNFESIDTKEISDIKIEEAPKQEINIGIVCAIIGAVLLLLLVILIFAVRKNKDNP